MREGREEAEVETGGKKHRVKSRAARNKRKGRGGGQRRRVRLKNKREYS